MGYGGGAGSRRFRIRGGRGMEGMEEEGSKREGEGKEKEELKISIIHLNPLLT